MCGFTKLYVDDLRDLPESYGSEWTTSRTVWEALTKLELIEFDEVSLDHDLACFIGNKELTGDDIVNWLVERKLNGFYVPPVVKVHSANPIGRQSMQAAIDKHLS